MDSDGFAGEKEGRTNSNCASKDASLKKKLISIRAGLLDVLKEIESMFSFMEEPIPVSEDTDRNKKMQEVNYFAFGYVNGGLSSLSPIENPKDDVHDRPPSPNLVPGCPPSPDYIPLLSSISGVRSWLPFIAGVRSWLPFIAGVRFWLPSIAGLRS